MPLLLDLILPTALCSLTLSPFRERPQNAADSSMASMPACLSTIPTALSLLSCKTLEKLLNLSVPQILPL